MENKKSGKLKWIIIVVIVIAIIGAAMSGGDDEKKKSEDTKKESTETVDIKEDMTKYKSGTYKVGGDIPAGEYVVFCDNSLDCYFEIASDSTGELDAIIANDNLSYNSIVTLNDGQYFKVTGGYAVPIEEVSELDTSGNGMFKVGTYLPAGEYKISVDEDSVVGYGYIEVSTDSSHVLSSIKSNDNIDGDSYITVSDGEYLKLSGCHIVQ